MRQNMNSIPGPIKSRLRTKQDALGKPIGRYLKDNQTGVPGAGWEGDAVKHPIFLLVLVQIVISGS